MTDKEMRCILIEYLAINNREFRIFQEKNICFLYCSSADGSLNCSSGSNGSSSSGKVYMAFR